MIQEKELVYNMSPLLHQSPPADTFLDKKAIHFDAEKYANQLFAFPSQVQIIP